ncbi:MAG: YihY/virulence factor BrkB family protein [Candidatus Hydrogenedentes bacterium]|nr:YihY/virulence factor BrkB family protein [Candidatus Hydrogenedentota bacterium]
MNVRNYIARASAALERGERFLRHDIWYIGKPGEAVPSGFVIRQVRVGILLFRGIVEETLLLRASALSFTTLLFLVPFLVFMFSFIQTFNLGDHIYGQISDWVNHRIEQVVHVVRSSIGGEETPRDDVGEEVVPAAHEAATVAVAPAATPPEASDASQELVTDILRIFLPTISQEADENGLADPVEFIVDIVESKATDVRTLGLTGLMYILITVLGLMRNVEWAFNRIWGVKETRSIFHSLSDYVMITLLLPIVAAAVFGLAAALGTNDSLGNLSVVLRGSQVLIISCTFAALYYFVPNTSVSARCAFVGGLFAGILWTLTSWAYVAFNVGLAQYTFFFSTFALFPMLLAWIYTSWVILLFGALVTFAYQNEKTFALERLADRASYAYRESVALRLMVEMVRRFAHGKPALSAGEVANAWNVPLRLVNEALNVLLAARLATACATQPVTYQPARAADTIHVIDVVRAQREHGEEPSQLRGEELYREIYAGLGAADGCAAAISLADLATKEG